MRDCASSQANNLPSAEMVITKGSSRPVLKVFEEPLVQFQITISPSRQVIASVRSSGKKHSPLPKPGTEMRSRAISFHAELSQS